MSRAAGSGAEGDGRTLGPGETERMTILRSGGPEVLQLKREPIPVVRHGEVAIRVRAAGLNFADIFAREGLYPPAPRPPFVPGFEVAGEIEALGDGVEEPPSRRVMAITRFGGYARRIVVEASRVFPLPDGWSFEEGAAFPAVYLTAYHGLANVARVRPGERVLVHSAAGGVGIAAGQILRAMRVEAIGTVGSAAKIAVAKEHGYAHVIDYRAQDFEAAVRDLTGGEGVDVVLDAIGGSFAAKGWRLLREGGRLIFFGAAGMTPRGDRPSLLRLALEYARLPRWNPVSVIEANRSVGGFQVLLLWHRADILADAMRRLLDLVKAGALRPRVGATFPLEEAAEAQKLLHSGTTTGKVVLRC